MHTLAFKIKNNTYICNDDRPCFEGLAEDNVEAEPIMFQKYIGGQQTIQLDPGYYLIKACNCWSKHENITVYENIEFIPSEHLNKNGVEYIILKLGEYHE